MCDSIRPVPRFNQNPRTKERRQRFGRHQISSILDA